MLGEQEHDPSGYIKGAARFAEGLDRDPEALKALITNLADTADAFASEEQNLRSAIRELPRTLTTGRRCGASSPTCGRPCAPPARRSTPSCR